MLGSMECCLAKHRRWRELISLLLVCSLGLCVAGWAEEEQPIRIAARSADKSAKQARISFSRPSGQPWKILGESQGYSMFRVSEMFEHDAFQSGFATINNEVLRRAADEEIGLSLANIELIQSNAVMTIHQIPEEKRNGPQKQSLNLGANAFDVRCTRQVNWPRAIDEIYIPAFGPEESEATKWIVKKMKENGISHSFRLESKQDENSPSTIENEHVKQLWSFVDGGTVAIAVAIPNYENDPWLVKELAENDPYQLFPWFQATQAVAIGIDLNSDSGRPKIRLALAPKKGHDAAEMVRQVGATRDLLIASESKLVKKMPEEEKSDLVKLMKDLKRWQVSIQQPVDDEGAPFVVLEGEITSIPMLLL